MVSWPAKKRCFGGFKDKDWLFTTDKKLVINCYIAKVVLRKGGNVVNRIEKVREVVDEILLNMTDNQERRCAYLHLYGVSQACALLAKKRKEDVELAAIAGMLHDIYCYSAMNSKDHAHNSAKIAKEILESLKLFTYDEINTICTAIYNHSDKAIIHEKLDEILKDADVMQHVLYNPLFDVKLHEQERFCLLRDEFGLDC